MERYVDLDLPSDVVGMDALRGIKSEGVKRHQLGIILDGGYEDEEQSIWLDIWKDGSVLGQMTHKAWSYRLKHMIGFALVSVEAKSGDAVEVLDGTKRIEGRLTELPFLG